MAAPSASDRPDLTSTDTPDGPAPVRSFRATEDGHRWEGVDVLHYKPTGTHFKDITRQVLFDADAGLPTQLRYFEVAPGGHSTFERHEHVHAVLILRGTGQCLVGETVYDVGPYDLVHIAPMTWHQFHAAEDEALGFLCLVDCDRDRPQRPDEALADTLRQHPTIGAFMRL